VNEKQVETYYTLQDVYDFAIVRQPSMNIVLSGLPANFSPEFVGVLYAKRTDPAWKVLATVSSNKSGDKINPYFLWIGENKKLTLSVIDTKGAGSGEGNESIWILDSTGWKENGCYYYQFSKNPSDLTDSAQLADQKMQNVAACESHLVR